MKHLSVLIILVLFCAGKLCAQFKKGDVELSITGGAGSLTTSSNYTGGSASSTNEFSQSRSYVVLSFSPAYFITDGLSIEPEFNLNAVEGSQPSHSMLINLGYTYLAEGTTVAPFVHAGYGLSNSQGIPFYPNVMFRVSDQYDVSILNAGGGLKVLAGSGAVIRFEVNYRSYRWTVEGHDYYYYSTRSEENKYSHVGLLFGVSLEL